jgi:hypothetical protein
MESRLFMQLLLSNISMVQKLIIRITFLNGDFILKAVLKAVASCFIMNHGRILHEELTFLPTKKEVSHFY